MDYITQEYMLGVGRARAKKSEKFTGREEREERKQVRRSRCG